MLRKIHQPWKTSVAERLSQSELGRDSLLDELDRFFELLVNAVESGDNGWLNPILIDWAASRTETDMEVDEVTLSPVLSLIMEELVEAAKVQFSPEEVIQLVERLMPVYHYSFEVIANHETLVRIGYVSAKLEKIQNELSQLDRSKSDFIAVAAHELKTPLTLIEGYSSMMGELVAKDEDVENKRVLLDGIKKGINRLSEIIDDMIDVSMIDNDLLSLKFQPTWINRILDSLVQEYKNDLNEREQILITETIPGTDEMIYADGERLYQAFKNVLSNAIKYTPNGGEIKLSGRKISDFVEIVIEDTGIGIAPEDQVRIFEKFNTLGNPMTHSSSKTSYKGGGPGLGLPITKGILDSHGGSIWVESEGYDEEKLPGCAFHILLPLRREPPDEQVSKLFETSSDE